MNLKEIPLYPSKVNLLRQVLVMKSHYNSSVQKKAKENQKSMKVKNSKKLVENWG